MGRGHMPFGYRIENGRAVVNAEEAEMIRKVYAGYLSGRGYSNAAKKAGIPLTHSSVKRMLQNKHYLGDEFYPAIIERKTFEAAEQERLRRVEALGRGDMKKTEIGEHKICCRFKLGQVMEKEDDPFERAAYIYSLIESEE